MMKYSPLGNFSAVGADSHVSISSTSQILPAKTLFCARKQVARPIVLAIKVRRSMPSFLARVSDISPIKCSTRFCGSDCGRGINSSFETAWVGMGETTPFLRSRRALGIHMNVDSCGFENDVEKANQVSYRTVGKVAFVGRGVKPYAAEGREQRAICHISFRIFHFSFCGVRGNPKIKNAK